MEGAARSKGSTTWCKEFPESLHENGASVDGTLDYLNDLSQKNDRLILVPSTGFWESKDHQVNRAIEEVRKITDRCFLWEFDADEQWDAKSMDAAEKELVEKNAKAGCFAADCYIGRNLMAIGDWGEARTYGYTRLWNWEGENFICHEPPVLEGLMGIDPTMLSPRFKHYNYYFEKDVAFKDAWYGGHEGILERWKLINSLDKRFFPMHISNLITGPWGKSNSAIVWNDRHMRIVQIGSHNGMDPVREMVRNGNYSCLLVEPNPIPFADLKRNYAFNKNCIFENCAVSSHDGEIEIHFSTAENKVSNSEHSSVSKDHVLKHGTLPEQVNTQMVECMTLASLLEKHGWANLEIEHLFIDTEGHDCEILLSTDFKNLNIHNITFETTHTDGVFIRGEKFERTLKHLDECGYTFNASRSTDANLTVTKRN